MKTSVDIFIAYSHDDKPQKDELKKFLRPLLNAGQIKVWDDHDIEAGRDWEAEIKKKLYGADIILLLVSHNSLASDYFYGKEVKSSLQRHERGEAVVVPVILSPCLWEETPISKLEALPAKARPVSQWPTQGEAFADIARNIAEITRRLLAQHRQLQDIEEQRRQYAAAVQAAAHLYAQQRWSEARKAYTDALALWQSSFEPASTTLQGRIAECDQALQRELDYARHIDNTRRHLQRQAWPKAAAEAALALRLKPGDEAALQLQQQATNVPVRENTPLAPTRIYVLVAVLAVIVVAVAIWVANSGGREKPATQTPENKQQTESSAYTQARTQGTIPAWRDFLDTYPSGQYRTNAQNELIDLEKKFNDKRKDARVFIDEKYYEDAREYLLEALDIWPGHKTALSDFNKIKNK